VTYKNSHEIPDSITFWEFLQLLNACLALKTDFMHGVRFLIFGNEFTVMKFFVKPSQALHYFSSPGFKQYSRHPLFRKSCYSKKKKKKKKKKKNIRETWVPR
jgi:hypothetical protein